MKKIISKTAVLMGAVAMFGWVGLVQGAVTLPVVESFEATSLPAGFSTDGTSSRGSAKVEGSYGRDLGELSTVSMAIDATNALGQPIHYSNAWIQVFIKAQPSSTPPDVTGATGAFYVDNNGNIQYRDSTAWHQITMTPALQTNTWIGFVVHADYEAPGWDLYCNRGNVWDGTSNMFVRVNASPLSFISAATALTSVKVSTGKASAMDVLAVSPSVRGVGVESKDCNKVLVCTYPATTPSDGAIFKLPVWVSAYNVSSTTSNSFADAAGQHILSGLATGDKISVYNPLASNPTKKYGSFTADGLGAWVIGGANWKNPLDFNIFPATAITLTRAGSTPTCGFFDYSNTTAYVEAEVLTANTVASAPVPQPLAGGWKDLAGGSLVGLNQVAWHGNKNETLQQIGAKLAAKGAIQNGDRAYLAVGGIFIELWWNSTTWYQQSAPADSYNGTTVDQQSFWLARQGTDGQSFSIPMGN